MVLKLTFVNGETHVFPFDSTSTLSVTTRTGDAASGVIEQSLSWSEIVGLALVDEHVADAVTEQTLTEQTLTEQAAAIDAPQAPAPEPEPEPEPAPVEPTPEPVPAPEPAPADTLASPAAAVEHAATLPVPDAAAHIEAALQKFPDDPDLVAAKADLDQQLQA